MRRYRGNGLALVTGIPETLAHLTHFYTSVCLRAESTMLPLI